MFLNILFCNAKHLLESFSARAKKEQVIRISKTASIVVVDNTTAAGDLEELKEVVHVEIEQNWRDNCSLANTIPDEKLLRIDSIPSHICCLIPVHINE